MAGLLRLVGARDERDENIGSVREPEAGWQSLHAEAARTRRHGGAFALMAVSGDATLAQALRPLLRVPDRTWVDGGVVYVLLTQCDARQAAGFVARAQARLPAALALQSVSIAVFPDHAVTVAGLVDQLRSEEASRRLQQEQPLDARTPRAELTR